MEQLGVLDQMNRLLDAADDATVNTSMRLPVALRRALETAVTEAAIEAHVDQHPHARPSLAEVTLALAAQDASPLAERPELLEHAAEQVLARHRDADADDVLLWAEAQLAMRA